MKKFFLSILFFMAGWSLLVAQEATFSEGDKVINLGLGLGNNLYSGSGFTSTIPPISASFEIGVKDGVAEKGSIGVGGYFGYTGAKMEMPDFSGGTYGFNYSSIIIGARGSFHYPFLDKLDSYAGLMIGYNIVKVTETGTVPMGISASSSGLAWSLYVGGRYYFTPKFAGMVELGYGIAILNIGVAFKL